MGVEFQGLSVFIWAREKPGECRRRCSVQDGCTQTDLHTRGREHRQGALTRPTSTWLTPLRVLVELGGGVTEWVGGGGAWQGAGHSYFDEHPQKVQRQQIQSSYYIDRETQCKKEYSMMIRLTKRCGGQLTSNHDGSMSQTRACQACWASGTRCHSGRWARCLPRCPRRSACGRSPAWAKAPRWETCRGSGWRRRRPLAGRSPWWCGPSCRRRRRGRRCHRPLCWSSAGRRRRARAWWPSPPERCRPRCPMGERGGSSPRPGGKRGENSVHHRSFLLSFMGSIDSQMNKRHHEGPIGDKNPPASPPQLKAEVCNL